MTTISCPSGRRLGVATLLVVLAATLHACAPRSPAEGLPGVPPSGQLRPAIEASRRSLESGDGGDARVRDDLDRFHGLHAMLSNPELRPAAEDSLHALWSADLGNVLWPELVAFNRRFLRDPRRFEALFRRPGFPDTAKALGQFLREWGRSTASPNRIGYRRAWAAREQLTPWQQAWLALRLARAERLDGHGDTAARLALEVLPAARALGGWRLEMEAWMELAQDLRHGEHLDDALHAVAMAEALARSVSRQTRIERPVLVARLERADLLAARREAGPALALYEACADEALSAGLAPLASTCLNHAGIFTWGIGQYERGLGYYRRAFVIAVAGRDSFNAPIQLANIGRRHLLLENSDSCRFYLGEAERWIRAYGDSQHIARFPLLQAEYFAEIGDFATVDSLHAVAERMSPKLRSVAQLAELHLQLIEQATERGRPDLAFRSIAALDALRDRLGTSYADRNEMFDLDVASAGFLGRQGLFVRAAQALDRADSALKRRPDPVREWELSRARGDLARRRNDLAASEAAYRACLAIGRERANADQEAQGRLLLASVLLDQGRFGEVRPLLPAESATAFGGRFRTKLEATILGAVAESRERRFEAALRDLERARTLCRTESPADLLARLDLETGRALAGLGRRDEARRAYGRVKERLAREARDPESGDPVVLDGDLRRELAEAMLVLAVGEPGGGLRGREAERTLHDLEALLPGWSGPRARQARPMAEPQLVYFVGAGASFRWTLAGDEASLQRLPGEAALLAALAPVVADLQEPGRPPVRADLVALEKSLGGLASGWSPGAQLTIVPDGALFAVPWPALPLPGASGGNWIDRGPIVLADAPARQEPGAAPTRRGGKRLLALGADSGPGPRGSWLAMLRHAEREAREVCALWPAGLATLRTGGAADLRSIAAGEMSSHDVIHIASHARLYQGLADQTTLLLADSAGAPMTAAEIRHLALRAEVVFLSCCEAAEGVRRGAGPAHAGLARSFLAAGARTVIAPATRIDDEAARLFAGRFYRHWLEGTSVSAALRSAQLDTRDGDARRSHPYYWAFYQAFGRASAETGSSYLSGGSGSLSQSEK